MNNWLERISLAINTCAEEQLAEILRKKDLEINFAKKMEELGIPQFLIENNTQNGEETFSYFFPSFNASISPHDQEIKKFPELVICVLRTADQQKSFLPDRIPTSAAVTLLKKMNVALSLKEKGLKVGFNQYHGLYGIAPLEFEYSWWDWFTEEATKEEETK